MSSTIMVPPGPNIFYNGRRVPLDGIAVPTGDVEHLKQRGWTLAATVDAPMPIPEIRTVTSDQDLTIEED